MVEVQKNRQFEAELGEIRAKLFEMGGKVELMIANSIKSLVKRDSTLAESVIAINREVNSLEQEIDSKCLRMMGQHQPAVRQLPFVNQVLKIVCDLERIGDECASIAQHALELNQEAQLEPIIDLQILAQAANTSVREALDAFMGGNPALAVKVCLDDRFIVELNDQIQLKLLACMMEDPATIGRALRINSISKYLERIADYAIDIAERVIFMIDGKDVRHSIV